MIKVGKEYAPISAKIIKGGQFTQFTVVQKHRVLNTYWKDGYINVLVKGEYTFHDGDTIVINKINGANLISFKGKQYFSLYAEVEYKTDYENKAGENLQTLQDDIPDEFL